MSVGGAKLARVIRRVGWASAGEVSGRAVNVLIPFVLISRYGSEGAVDSFFLALAVAFYFQGALGNALVAAIVPEVVKGPKPISLLMAAGWSIAGAFVAVFVAVCVVPHPISAVAMAAVGLMAFSGLIAAPAVASLNADHRYGMPGMLWGLRLVPIVVLWAFEGRELGVDVLLFAMSLADLLRSAILIRSVPGCLRLSVTSHQSPVSRPMLEYLAASAVAGMTPVIARWIASLGDPGGVTLLEAADRLYSAVASLATIGVGSVMMVYLARLSGTEGAASGWRLIQLSALAWTAMWFAFGGVAWMFIEELAPWPGIGDESIGEMRDVFGALLAGLPAFMMTGVYGRQLLALGRTTRFLPITAAGGLVSALGGAALHAKIGLLGIALAISAGQYVVLLFMMRAVAHAGKYADSRSR